jgi:hypothetical protein
MLVPITALEGRIMPESQSEHSNVPLVAIERPECPNCQSPMILRNMPEPAYFCKNCDDTLGCLFGGLRSPKCSGGGDPF